MIKKIIACVFLLFSFYAKADCIYGIGIEGTSISNGSEEAFGQIQRSLKTVAVGAKCDKFTFSTTDLWINNGYDVVVVGGVKVHTNPKRWTIGYQIKEWYIDNWQLGVGASINRVFDGEKKYIQNSLVFGAVSKKRIAVFLNVGDSPNGILTGLGFYYVFGAK